MKKIVVFILPLLFALAFLNPVRASASGIPEDVQKSARDIISSFDNLHPPEGEGKAHCNTYIFYQAYGGGYGLVLTPEPDAVWISSYMMSLRLPSYYPGSGYNNRIYYWYIDDNGNASYTYSRGSDSSDDETYCSTGANAVSILASNATLKSLDGNIFFQRAPLKGRILTAVETQLGMEMPTIMKIAVCLVGLLVSSLLLLRLLPPLVKKSIRLLAR